MFLEMSYGVFNVNDKEIRMKLLVYKI